MSDTGKSGEFFKEVKCYLPPILIDRLDKCRGDEHRSSVIRYLAAVYCDAFEEMERDGIEARLQEEDYTQWKKELSDRLYKKIISQRKAYWVKPELRYKKKRGS